MDKNNAHIEDDFLKKLISLPEDEKLPNDFTRKVMVGLPKVAVAPVEAKRKIDLRIIGLIAAVSITAIFIFFNFDFSGIFKAAAENPENNPVKYLNLLTSISKSFSDGFSGIKISSISITAIIALASLYFADIFFKKWFNQNHTEAI